MNVPGIAQFLPHLGWELILGVCSLCDLFGNFTSWTVSITDMR